MKIERIQKTNVSQQVDEQMRQMILVGEWKSGDRLPSENELASFFGVSRVTIRQALQKLGALGIVDTRLGDGSYIKELSFGTALHQILPAIYLSEDSIRDVLGFRIITEVETAAIAARKATEEDVAELRRCYEDMRAVKDDLAVYVKMDFHYHMLITRIAGNPVVTQIHHVLRDVLNLTIMELTKTLGTENGLKYHREITAAIEKHDEDAARILMSKHLTEILDRYESQKTKGESV